MLCVYIKYIFVYTYQNLEFHLYDNTHYIIRHNRLVVEFVIVEIDSPRWTKVTFLNDETFNLIISTR